ncbi:MAG TPA: AbfB domain-containing protein [Kineosporiaceae bacterium]
MAGTLAPGSTISLRATTACCTNRFVRDDKGRGITSVITPSSSGADRSDSTWIVRAGLASPSCVSFESRTYPGQFLRHSSFQIYRQPMDGTDLFRADATFCPTGGKSGSGTSFQSYNYPTKYLRHYFDMLYIASDGGGFAWDAPAFWADDVSWVVTTGWVF